MDNRFWVWYRLFVHPGEDAREKAEWISLEQSVELPRNAISDSIFSAITGHINAIKKESDSVFHVQISWPLENIGNDPTQLLNILFGNISLKHGIKIVDVEWEKIASVVSGPAFGISGIRALFELPERALSCGVLKPMGLSAASLAQLCYEMAGGGLDFIKDDHGLANQSYAPFEERVKRCVDAIRRAEKETGYRARYFPHITSSAKKMLQNYRRAAELGADGVLVIPHLCGYEAMMELAASEIPLPIMAHPAFSGALVTDPNHGIEHAVLYGSLYRAFGADFCVYPNTGGRFAFSPDQCAAINSAARGEQSPFKPVFPMPGGGVSLEKMQYWLGEYGTDTIFLMGGGLFSHPAGLKQACRKWRKCLEHS